MSDYKKKAINQGNLQRDMIFSDNAKTRQKKYSTYIQT